MTAAMLTSSNTAGDQPYANPYTAGSCHALTASTRASASSAWVIAHRSAVLDPGDPSTPTKVLYLAAAASHAQQTQAADPAWRAELAYWAGGTRPAGDDVPDAATPLPTPQTTMPGRDFGHHGDLPVSAGHDRDAGYAVLFGPDDQPRDWLRAGEALSSAWLTAVELGVSLLPLNATVEVAGTRQTLRRLVADLGWPYLVLRLGMFATDDAGPPHAPRLPVDQTIDRR